MGRCCRRRRRNDSKLLQVFVFDAAMLKDLPRIDSRERIKIVLLKLSATIAKKHRLLFSDQSPRK